MGTSAGALAGSLYCAGYTPRQVAKHLSEQAPAELLRPSVSPWRGGALSLDGVIARLRDLLPPTFEELEREFAVGVVTADGQHVLLDSGPLPEAVAASAAIPFIFEAVDVPGQSRHGPFKDGGVVDRVGLRAWRERRRSQLRKRGAYLNGNGNGHLNGNGNGHLNGNGNGHLNGNGHVNGHAVPLRPPPCLVHVIDRSSPFSGFDDTSATGESHIVVVKSPRSGANFFDLGSFDDAMEAARHRAEARLLALRRGGGGSGPSSNGNGAAPPPPSPQAIRVTIS
ncbi:hypothetical protein GPECTOR_36g125 [Gonium pectorale]|uniref:Patatin n=1 Tax=Gonium pectorale TaxID=33097 RepID=A0A150GBX9_GONPE|nr:hypothetical protein GPECTOR_36g125 [Gonium pectorale]|eukprot:KXZ47273.1 hypothetical protein GPECTOR_36g125 [Gonium pectorale]